MENKYNILIVGDSLKGFSGLSHVAFNFLKSLYKTNNYNISYCAISGQMYEKDKPNKVIYSEEDLKIIDNIKLYYTPLFDAQKVESFDKLILEFKPDLVISFVDPWMLDQIAYCFYRESYKWIAYLTIETPEYPEMVSYPTPVTKNFNKSIKEILAKADLLLPCTQMAISTLEKLKLPNIYEDNLYCGLDIQNVEVYKKSDIFNLPEDNFVFMTVGTNSERKRIDQVIEAFNLFLKKQKEENRKKFKLYIHSNFNQLSGGTDLKGMINHLKLMNNILIPSNYGASKEVLYKKYMTSDCYIGLAGGEGFGYGYAEALMFEKPIVYIDYGGHVEYCKDFGVAIEPDRFYSAINAYIKFALPNLEYAANNMTCIVNDYEKYKQKAVKGRQFVIDNFDWAIVKSKFVNIIEKFIQKNIDSKEKSAYNLYVKRII